MDAPFPRSGAIWYSLASCQVRLYRYRGTTRKRPSQTRDCSQFTKRIREEGVRVDRGRQTDCLIGGRLSDDDATEWDGEPTQADQSDGARDGIQQIPSSVW